jgi:hypothetical protein
MASRHISQENASSCDVSTANSEDMFTMNLFSKLPVETSELNTISRLRFYKTIKKEIKFASSPRVTYYFTY